MKINLLPVHKKIIDAFSVICLIAVFIFSFAYLQNWKTESAEGATGEIGKEEERRGTWCTIKSNSLDGVPIYDEPDGAMTVGSLPEGKLCELIDSQIREGKKWGKVEYAGLSGWMKMSFLHYLCPENISIRKGSIIYINASTEKGIRMYQQPDVRAKVIADKILYGTEYQIQEVKSGWGKVNDNGRIGWINLYYAGCYPPQENAAWKVETLSKAQEINFRQAPGENQRSIGKVPENQYLEMIDFQNGWGKTQYNGQTGWVMLSYLTPCAKE